MKKWMVFVFIFLMWGCVSLTHPVYAMGENNDSEIQAGKQSAPIQIGVEENQQVSIPILFYNLPDGKYPAEFSLLPEGVRAVDWIYNRGYDWELLSQGDIIVEAGVGNILFEIDSPLFADAWQEFESFPLSVQVDNEVLTTNIRLETVKIPAELMLIRPNRVLPAGHFSMGFSVRQLDAAGEWIDDISPQISWEVEGLVDADIFETWGGWAKLEIADTGIAHTVEVTAYLTAHPEISATGKVDIQPDKKIAGEALIVGRLMINGDSWSNLETSPNSKLIIDAEVRYDNDTTRLLGDDELQVLLESDNPDDFVQKIDNRFYLIHVGDAQEEREIPVVFTLLGEMPQTIKETIRVIPDIIVPQNSVTIEENVLIISTDDPLLSRYPREEVIVNIVGLPIGLELTPQGRNEIGLFVVKDNTNLYANGFVETIEGVAKINLDTSNVPAGTYEIVVRANFEPAIALNSTHVVNLVVE